MRFPSSNLPWLHWTLVLSLSVLVSAVPVLTGDTEAKKTSARQTEQKSSTTSTKKRANKTELKKTKKAAAEKTTQGQITTRAMDKEPASETVETAKDETLPPETSSSKQKDIPTDAASLPAPEFEKLTPQTLGQLQALYNAMHQEARGISNEVRDDEELATKDIALLWQAAVERSGTIRYAIEKLSNREATGRPVSNDGFTRKMVQNIARLGGMAGSMWTGTPTGMLGGNMVDNLLSGDPNESALQRITDADMVLLAKEVETLQSRVIELYYQYHQAQERLGLVQEANRTLGRYYDQALGKETLDPALETLMATLYETSKQEEDKARQAFASARDALTLVVGPDAMTAFEKIRKDEAS